MALVEVTGLQKIFSLGQAPVIKNLSFSLEAGEILTLLGPSGCGKTTTLRLLAGFERPDAGSIVVDGQAVADQTTWLPAEKRGIGMVFQDYALFPHMTVAENIAFPLRGYSKTAIQDRVCEILDIVGLSQFAARYPHELSGGQQQRVALGRALSPQPRLILLDEPFSNLDASLRVEMRREVREIIKKTGATAIFVSHDQKDALAVSDRLLVLHGGQLLQCGTPREIYQFPATRAVAEFVGRSNIIKGKIDCSGTGIQTFLGLIPCRHTHDLLPGEQVLVSIRPESFELNSSGAVSGQLRSAVYVGDAIEGELSIKDEQGQEHCLMVHIHPEEDVKVGDTLNFIVLPDFVAVIEQ